MTINKTNSKLINIGLVGVGDHMEENLLPALTTIPNLRFEGIVSRSSEKSKRLKAAWDISKSYNNVVEMLEDKLVELVICSGSPDFHQSVIKETIDRKIPIFIEKPSCLDPLFFSQIQNKALNNQVLIFTGYNFIYSDAFIQYQKLVAEEPSTARHRYIQTQCPSSTAPAYVHLNGFAIVLL